MSTHYSCHHFILRIVSIICCSYFLAFHLVLSQHKQPSLQQLPWKQEKIAKGLIWQSLHTDQLFDSKQFISVLAVSKKRALSVDYEVQELKPTSEFAEEEGALAAVNAGFFDMKEGGSVTFLKVDDEVINGNTSEAKRITRSFLAVDDEDGIFIIASDSTAWLEDPANYDDVLFTGPLLLKEGMPMEQDEGSFITRRHPRTCACTKRNGGILLVTIDGRNEEADGMSIAELTTLMKELGCYNAINLDGGGSTTMWIHGKGVVNHPSDNRTFDAEGERRVANVLLVH